MSFPNLSMLAVRERAVTQFFLAMSVVLGIWSFLSLGRAEDPGITVRALVVTAAWPGATPEELQSQVVLRLEKRIQEINNLEKVETTIRPGMAIIQIKFLDDPHAPSSRETFYEVRKRMLDEERNMPAGVVGPIVNDDFADVYFNLIAITAPGMPMRELTREAEVLRDRLQRIPGVQKALVLGERSERVYLDFDPARLLNLGISPQQVFAAIEANNRLLPAGRMESDGPRIHLRLDADLADPAQLADVPLRIGNRLLKLADIATIQRGYEDPPSYLIRSRGQDTILLGAVMRPSENGLELGKRMRAFIETERQALPLGMSMEVLVDQAAAIAYGINLFQIKFLVAVLVVVIVSILAIGMRAGLIVGISVPLTLGITFMVMKSLDITLNRITLGALIIALGLLVDDAIIAVEMMLVKMEEGWDRYRAASHAWTVTAAPMLFGTLVTVAGFFPIGFARSGVGEYCGPMFWVLGIALIASWLVAVTFAPHLGVRMLPDFASGAIQSHESIYQTPRYRRIRGIITWCVMRRKTVVGTVLALLALSIVAMATVIPKQFFPTSERPEILISIFLPQGTSIAVTDRVARKIEAMLAQKSEIKKVSTYVGGGPPRFFITANPELPDQAFAKIVAVAQDVKARNKIVTELRQKIANGEIPEARVILNEPLYGPQFICPVAFRVIGPDPLVLRRIAHQVRTVMAANPHIVDPYLDWDERAPVMHLTMDVDRLRLLGLTPQDVAQQLQFQMEGTPVTQVRQDIRTVDVIARMARRDGRPADKLGAMELLTSEGRKLPLEQLGKLEVRFENPVIRRHNLEPVLTVQGGVHAAQPNDVTVAVWKAMEEIRGQLPPGYHIDIGGQYEEAGRSNNSISEQMPIMVALMLIFIMLQVRSIAGTLIVAATAPLGLIGAVIALLLFQQPFGFAGTVGLIGLAGILMRNTLILTQQVSDNFSAGMPALEGVVEAAVQRARPVALTGVAAAFAFVPLTQDSFWGPMAYALIGGIVVGTAITLLFVPALYALWFRLKKEPGAGAAMPLVEGN